MRNQARKGRQDGSILEEGRLHGIKDDEKAASGERIRSDSPRPSEASKAMVKSEDE